MAVGRYPPNAWGLFDMHGNAWQWCYDRSADFPRGLVAYPDEVQVFDSRTSRAMRGGSWSQPLQAVRSAVRYGALPDDSATDRGFRVVLETTFPEPIGAQSN